VNKKIAPKLVGMDPARQAEVDRTMIELDGTANKGKLGANAILEYPWPWRERRRRAPTCPFTPTSEVPPPCACPYQ